MHSRMGSIIPQWPCAWPTPDFWATLLPRQTEMSSLATQPVVIRDDDDACNTHLFAGVGPFGQLTNKSLRYTKIE